MTKKSSTTKLMICNKRAQNENTPLDFQEIRVNEESEVTPEEQVIIDELKVLWERKKQINTAHLRK